MNGCRLSLIALGSLAAWPASAQFPTHLSPATDQAFEQYRIAAEAKMDWSAHFASAQAGSVTIAPLSKDGPAGVKDGLIHDWSAATIAPGVTAERVVGLLQDYPNYKNVYALTFPNRASLGAKGMCFTSRFAWSKRVRFRSS